MRMRPIWLMNPDVASRILPLKAGLFDLVVYDEASQMPVEHAVPTLFRSRRVLVAGDEKQMPPSSFFAGRIDGDEDEDSADGDSLDEGATEAERTAREETWNRREVKDCPDLLQLARGVLPVTTLQIHYRSKYRELIGYSNAAFYKGDLSVPARHPEAEVQRARPVEVVRVDGVYEDQTNVAEAAKVVDLLARLWLQTAEPPSGRGRHVQPKAGRPRRGSGRKARGGGSYFPPGLPARTRSHAERRGHGVLRQECRECSGR